MGTKISALPSGTIAATDSIPVVKSGVTTKVAASFMTDIATNTSNIATNTSDISSLKASRTTDEANISTIQSQVLNAPALTALDQSSWSWVNQGSATVVQGSNVVYLTAPNSPSDSWRVRTTSAPFTKYTITAYVRCRYTSFGANQQQGGICFSDSSGKLYFWYVSSANQLQAVKWTNATTFSAVGPVNTGLLAAGQWHYLQIEDDGTNLKFRSSLDGVNFETNGSESRTAFFTSGPTLVGIACSANTNIGTISVSYASWKAVQIP